MQKDVALDPHGNPLPEDEHAYADGDVALESGDLSERARLTAHVEDDAAEDELGENRVSRSSSSLHLVSF